MITPDSRFTTACPSCDSRGSIWINVSRKLRPSGFFRETLVQVKIVESLFGQFDAYLAEQSLQHRGSQLIDASLVPVVQARELARRKRDGQPGKRRQNDTQARWTVKHGDNHFGNKNHVNMATAHKLIRQDTVTDAAVHDRRVLEEVRLAQETGRDV